MKLNKIVLITTVFILAVIFDAASAFADTGGSKDGNVSGGGCAPDGATSWWDTCHGATWKWYSADSDSITIPAAGNVSGGTIVGCKTAGGGYWRYGLDHFNPSNGASYGDQAGLVLKGTVDFDAAHSDADLNTIKEIFDDYADEFANKGYKWDEGNFSAFCGSRTPSQSTSFQTKAIAYIQDGDSSESFEPDWNNDSNQTYTLKKSATVSIYFKHRVNRNDSNSNVKKTTTAARTHKVNGEWSGTYLLADDVDDGNPKPFTAGATKDLFFIDGTWHTKKLEADDSSTTILKRGEVKNPDSGASTSDKIITKTLSPGETVGPICRGLGVYGSVESNRKGKYKSGSAWQESTNCVTLRYPWNFTTSPQNSLGKMFYVGENINSHFSVTINKKDNSILYSGLPSDAVMVGVVFKYPSVTSSASVDLSGGDTNSNPCSLFNGQNCYTFNLDSFDVSDRSIGPAPDEVGAKVCTATAINYSESDNNGNAIKRWRVSNANCAVIAKKPTIKVEGGPIYSAGNIKTSTSFRDNKTYGSWGEYLVIGGNSSAVANLASGANLRNGLDGNKTTGDFSPLTIANNNTSSIGKSGIATSNTFINNIKARFIDTDDYNHNLVNVLKLSGDETLTPTQVNNLNDNKLNIIYGNNINIAADVSTINAWLIADNTINTCAGQDIGGDLLAAGCDRELTINGLAYAKSFKFMRTYGAIKSGATISPQTTAEAIRLSANDYRRAYDYSSTNYSQPTEVYLEELAPRV